MALQSWRGSDWCEQRTTLDHTSTVIDVVFTDHSALTSLKQWREVANTGIRTPICSVCLLGLSVSWNLRSSCFTEEIHVVDGLCDVTCKSQEAGSLEGIWYTQLASSMSVAWELVRQIISRAQRRQKDYYDQRGRQSNFNIDDWVFLSKPGDKTGEARKFAGPYHGPYRVIDSNTNTARVRRVDKPEEATILVSLY